MPNSTRTLAPRALLIVLLGCVVGALLIGPVGRFWVALPILLFGPGFLLERAYPAFQSSTAFARPALWLGLSLSLIGLLYEWITFAGLSLSAPIIQALAALVGLAAAWALWRDIPAAPVRRIVSFAGLAFAGIFALAFVARMAEISTLALPPWVDSVHHALLIRVAAERGQAPYTLRPYMPIDDLPYHWGYHVTLAALMQISGLGLPQLMLWAGQALNALQVLACAALAAYVWRRPLAGALAGLVVGLLSIMPAYYVSWGRYTQLTGLLLLPALAIVWDAGLRAPSRRRMVYAALLLAGLSIVHFRILIFALALAAAIGAIWALAARPAQLRAGCVFAVQATGLSLVLAGPWLWLIARRALFPAFAQPSLQLSEGSYNMLNLDLLWAGQNRLLIALTLAAALWGLRRHARATAEQVAWVGALAVLANPWLLSYLLPAAGASLVFYGLSYRRPLVACCAAPLLLLNPQLVRLPYLSLIPNDIVAISLFVPIAVLLGGAGAWLAEWIVSCAPAWRRQLRVAGALLLGLTALWGAWSLRSVVNPATVFATAADARAIAWAADNTPASARFLINATGWLPGVDRGADGGWWLLPLDGRWTSTPPALFVYGEPDYIRAVQARNDFIARFQAGQISDLARFIRQEQIDYIYLGSQAGRITVAALGNQSALTTVYNEDGVIILAVSR